MSSAPKKSKPTYNQYTKLPKDVADMVDSFKPKQKECECDCNKPIPHTIQTRCEGTCRQKCCKHLRFEDLLTKYFWADINTVHVREVTDFIDKHPCVLRAGYRTPLATMEKIYFTERAATRGTLHETLTTCIIRTMHQEFAFIHWNAFRRTKHSWMSGYKNLYNYSHGINSWDGTYINGRVDPNLSIEKCRALLSERQRSYLKKILAKCKVLLGWVFRKEPLLARYAYRKDVPKQWSHVDHWYQTPNCDWMPPIFLVLNMVPILTDQELKSLCEVFVNAWPQVIYLDFSAWQHTAFEALRDVLKHTMLVKTSKTNTEKLLFGGLKGFIPHPLGGIFGDKIHVRFSLAPYKK